MNELKECALCGAGYLNAEKHQAFHDDIDAWVELIEVEIEHRLRGRAQAKSI